MIPRRVLPFETWPESDRLAWTTARRPSDPFSRAGGAADCSEKNCRQIVKSYGRWLQYLNLAGQLVPEMPPAARVSEVTLLGIVAALRQDDLSSETVYSTLRNLKDMLRVMDPVADLGILKRLVARLDRERTPRRHKPQRIEDPRRLLRAGLEFIEGRAYSREPGHNSQLRAGWVRSGLNCRRFR